MKAIPLAEAGKLVTFGIMPTEVHTGYGYVKAGYAIGAGYEVASFEEKPDRKSATQYISEGSYYWNSGMFLFKATNYLEALREHRPDIASACADAMADATSDLHFMRINTVAFEASPSESIDYAVMQKTDNAVVVLMEAGWSDIGSWSSLWDVSKKDDAGNVAPGDVKLRHTENSFIRADHGLAAVVGLNDVVVV